MPIQVHHQLSVSLKCFLCLVVIVLDCFLISKAKRQIDCVGNLEQEVEALFGNQYLIKPAKRIIADWPKESISAEGL